MLQGHALPVVLKAFKVTVILAISAVMELAYQVIAVLVQTVLVIKLAFQIAVLLAQLRVRKVTAIQTRFVVVGPA